MSLAVIPEFEVLNLIKLVIAFIRRDTIQNEDLPGNSYLYQLLINSASLGRYNSYEQAKKIFLTDEADPRYLDCNLMFNMAREGAPTIHITLPNETPNKNGDGIGIDEEYLLNSTIFDDEENIVALKSNYTRSYQANYHIVITSDNTNEVIIIYNVLRSLLTSFIPHISLKSNFRNIMFGGQDISIESSLIPKSIFFRAISMVFQYETSSPNIFNNPIFKDLIVKGIPKDR